MPQAGEGSPASVGGLGRAMMRRLDELARLSRDDGALTRLFASAEHRAASELIAGWMRAAGMETAVDAVGNTVGRYEGERSGLPAVILGSHQDTVVDAGRYDGMLGIVAAMACVEALHARAERLPFAVEVVAFGDEEGVRFGASMMGSRALAGTFDPAVLARTDADGVTMAEALRAFGVDPDGIPALARRRRDVLAFLEVHIEQGPVLEREGLPLGVVTAIAGISRFAVTVEGRAGHAGTVPMDQRRDGLAAAAECVLAVEGAAAEADGLVATVGRLAVEPGAMNVIPGRVRFTVDLRHEDDRNRRAAVEALHAAMRTAAERRGVGLAVETIEDTPACPLAPALVDALAEAVRAEGIAPRRLYSGAGHDAQVMAALTDAGMLFVRCRDGVSHSPDEAITAADAELAVRALLRFLRGFRPDARCAARARETGADAP